VVDELRHLCLQYSCIATHRTIRRGDAVARDRHPLGHWRSDAAEATFGRLLAELQAEVWSTPPTSVTIETRVGATVVLRVEGTGPPVVLLPGFGAPALMYRPELLDRLGGRPLHLVETIGDVGPSVQTAPIRTADDQAAWLNDVLDGVQVERAHLVGCSYGGHLAMNHGLRASNRVRSITGLEPALAPAGGRMWRRSLAVLLCSFGPEALRRRAAARLHQPALEDRRVLRVGRLAYTRHVFGQPRPGPFTDDELAAISTPALILLGADSELHHADELQRRLARVMPSAHVEVVCDAGHSLPFEHPGLCGDRVGRFLDSVDAAITSSTE
jgi:pimeloyl-ACP methyl ester carboxylesterase